MTVSSLTTKNSYSGNASTTTFAYGFKIFTSAEIKVFIRSAAGTETLKTLTTHYTLANVGNASGGNVVFESDSVPAATETVVLIRDTALTQTLDLVENDPFLSGSFENSLDKVTHQMIELQEEVDRSFKVSQTNSITSAEFTDSAATRASKTLGFDSDGNLTTVADFLPKGGDSAQFTYSTTTTDSDPGSGIVRFNNSSIGSATIAYIDDLDAAGTDVSAWVQSFDDVSGNDTNRGRIRVSKSNTLDTWHVFKVSAAVADASGYTKVTLTYIDGAGTLANEDKIFISFVASGEDGSIPGYFYKFDAGTSKADPGAGELSFNNGTYANVTKICIDDADSHGVTTQADTATWGSSTSTIKGFLHIVDINDETTYARFKVTAAASDESGFNELTVVHLASNNTFSATDELSVHFSQSGNTGDTGAVGPAGAAGVSLTWETSTGDSDQGAGKIWGNNGTVASISVLYIDDVDANSTNIEAWIQTLDDSTNSALRGTIYLEEAGTNSQFGVFSVTGACVDGTGYWKIPVSHVASNVGSLADGDSVGVVFLRTGNVGADGADGDGTFNDFTLTADSGSNQTVANGNTVDIAGGNSITTVVGATDTVTINADDGTASAKGAVIVAGTSPVSVGYSSGTATVAVSDASTSAKGIASFASADFAVSSGAVTLEAAVVKTDEQNTFTKAQVPSTYTAALSATSGVLDFDTYQTFIITLAAGSNTLAAPTTEASQIGQSGVMIFVQPGSGSAATLSLHADYETAAAAGLTISSANNDYDVVPYIIKADNSVLLGAPQLNFG